MSSDINEEEKLDQEVDVTEETTIDPTTDVATDTETVAVAEENQVTEDGVIEVEEAEGSEGSEESEESEPVAKEPKVNAKIIVMAIINALLVCVIIVIIVILVQGKTKTSTIGDSEVSGTTNETVIADNAGTNDTGFATKEYNVTVALGEYKGVEVDYELNPVTDDDIDKEIQSFLQDLAEMIEITDRAVEDGDTANIDFTGYMDGEKFEGGEAKGFDLEIGSGSFIPGFEEGLVGVMPGQTVSLDIAFPDPYIANPDLAGKPVLFEVTVNSINKEVIPEFTDDVVAENSDFETTDAYKKYVLDYLTEDRISEADDKVKDDILKKIIDGSSFGGDIDEQINAYAEEYIAYWDSMAQSYYGVDGATLFLYMYGLDEEAYKKLLTEESAYSIKLQYVLDEIAKAENFEISAEEYEDSFAELFLDYYGFETKEEVFAEISKEEADEMVNKTITRKKAEDFVADNAIVNK